MGSKHAVLYCRTSAHAEPELASCVEQAKRLAEESGFRFDGSPEAIRSMIQRNLSQQGDVYVDIGPGDKVSNRPGQNAFCLRACIDRSVALLLVSNLSRLGRNTAEVIQFIFEFYALGGKIVFLDECSELGVPPNSDQHSA